MRQFGCACVHGKRSLPLGAAALERARERLRVELHAIRAEIGGPADRRLLGIDEEADADAGGAHIGNRARERVARCLGRPARLARDLARADRHQRALIGADAPHELQQIRPRVAFDVVLDPAAERREKPCDVAHIGRGDVPRVCPRMHRDARRSRVDAEQHGVDDRRHRAAARVAHGRHLVDVDGEFDQLNSRLPNTQLPSIGRWELAYWEFISRQRRAVLLRQRSPGPSARCPARRVLRA